MSKVIELKTDFARLSQVLNETLDPVVISMQGISELVEPLTEGITLQFEPLKEYIEEFMDEYNKSIQPLIKAMDKIQQDFTKLSSEMSKIIDRHNLKEIVIDREDIDISKSILANIGEDISLDDIDEDNREEIEDCTVKIINEVIEETRCIHDNKFVVKDFFIGVNKLIPKNVKKQILDISKGIIIAVVSNIIISNIFDDKPTNTNYYINNINVEEIQININNDISYSKDIE